MKTLSEFVVSQERVKRQFETIVFDHSKQWKDSNFMFNDITKDRFLRNILCQLKSELLSTQNEFDIIFKRIRNPKHGGYLFEISKYKKAKTEKNSIERMKKLETYVRTLLEWILSEDILINVKTSKNKTNSSFEILFKI